MSFRAILLGALVLVASFIGATLLMNLLWPTSASLQQGRPALVAVPALQPLSGSSTVLTPAAVAMTAIREALDAQAPKNLSGKPQTPVSQLLSNAQLTFNVTRGPFAVSGRSDSLIVSTPLTGSFQALGTLAGAAGTATSAAGSAIGNLIGGSTGQQLQGLGGKTFDQHADISGTIITAARPTIATNWRLAPNLVSQVSVVDVVLPIGGVKLSVANAVKPALDAGVKEQTNALEQRLRADPFIETAARSQWVKLCRAVSLGSAGQGMPNLWLEIRPVRAIAAQPLIAADAVTLLVGVQAQTRIVPSETKPVCPFPQQLDLVPQSNSGTVDIAVPIDIPFPEVNRLLAAQIGGKTFPEDGSGSFAATIKQAAIAASGDRLLISLLVNIKKRGLFSFFGADATVHVYGKPVLDQDRQILRFTDVALDVQSQAAFGILGAAAQAAVPYLQKTLAEKAVIDLKPLATDAKQRIAKAVGDLAGQAPGMSAKAAISDLRLTGVAYDANTLRIIGAAKGAVNVAISSLSGL
jgi:hypothetical protein